MELEEELMTKEVHDCICFGVCCDNPKLEEVREPVLLFKGFKCENCKDTCYCQHNDSLGG